MFTLARELLCGRAIGAFMSRSFLRTFIFAFAVLGAASAVGCSSDDKGAPPTIHDFTLTPTTMDVGKATFLEATVTVEDPDGDIAGLSVLLELPDGTAQGLQQPDVASGDAKSAPILLKAQLTLPAAGDYTVVVWARDRAGNESAKLRQKLSAK
jgi:hypothetical protein